MPKLSADKEQMIAANLNLYLFQNVWNETSRSLRNNVLPQMLNQRAINGSFLCYGEDTPLPTTTDAFYVYAAARNTLAGLTWPKHLKYDWISTDTLVNEYNILLDVYHIHGKMFSKKDVHVLKLTNNLGYLIAINKDMSDKIVKHAEMINIRFTIYFDVDIANDIHVKCYTVPMKDNSYLERSKIWNQYQQYLTVPEGTKIPTVLLFIDGVETTPVDITSIPLGACIDIQVDHNAYIDEIIDISTPDKNYGFFSEIDKCYKQVIHIPRDANPEQYVLTHNAMEIYVRKATPEPDGTIKGLYLHRCAERSVTQITHQDIGIPMYILDAFRDYLDTSEIVLRVYWRKHDNPNRLIRDKNYIDMLYSRAHAERELLGYLTGNVKWSNELYFWKASHLEQSEYIKMFFDVPDIITPANMTYYIEALGYYNVMCLLCKHVHRATITEWYDGGYLFAKPLVYQGYPIYAVVYGNGVKIHDSQVSIKNETDTHVSIAVPKSTEIGTQISIEMYMDGTRDFFCIRPELGSIQLEIPPMEYDILEQIPSGSVTTAYDHSSEMGYKLFTSYAGNIVKRTLPTGNYQLTFGPAMYNRVFYICPKPRVLYWSSKIKKDQLDLQTKMLNGDPLFFPLEKTCRYEYVENKLTYINDLIPVWDIDSLLVYINGRYLIKDIDYTVQSVNNLHGNMCMQMLIIQNYSYLREDLNTLEVYSTSAAVENRETGYCATRYELPYDETTIPADTEKVVAGIIKDGRTFVYNDDTSIIHVNGYYTQAIVYGNNLNCDPSWVRQWENANPLEIRTSVPYFISDYLKKYHSNDDLERIELLNKYFFGRDLRVPDTIVIEQAHLTYSVYTAAILRDVILQKNIELSYDPDIVRMIDQLGRYQYLADIDLITNKLINLDYVDIYPHYKQLVAPDIEIYRLLQAIIKITMPEDPVSNKKDIDLTHP